MQKEWQLTLLWGVLVGTGTGVTSMVLAAVVATRWFDERRGLVLGALSAANATGQLVFLPLLASVVETQRLAHRRALRRRRRARSSSCSSGCSCATVRKTSASVPTGSADARGTRQPARWRRSRRCDMRRIAAFWVLAGTFFVCGASTNGLIGTHLIAACHDYGIPQVRSAQLLAIMGIFDILGTTASGG